MSDLYKGKQKGGKVTNDLNISKNITLRDIHNGYEANIKNLDMFF